MLYYAIKYINDFFARDKRTIGIHFITNALEGINACLATLSFTVPEWYWNESYKFETHGLP